MSIVNGFEWERQMMLRGETISPEEHRSRMLQKEMARQEALMREAVGIQGFGLTQAAAQKNMNPFVVSQGMGQQLKANPPIHKHLRRRLLLCR